MTDAPSIPEVTQASIIRMCEDELEKLPCASPLARSLREIMAAVDRLGTPHPVAAEGLIEREAAGWNDGAVVPIVKRGRSREYIVAVRRKDGGRVYSFAAQYLNAMPLEFEWEDSGRETTGWFSAETDCDDGTTYREVLGEGDTLMGWCEVPQWHALRARPPVAVPGEVGLREALEVSTLFLDLEAESHRIRADEGKAKACEGQAASNRKLLAKATGAA